MDISIRWRLDFRLEVESDGIHFKRTKLDEPRWLPFDMDDIINHSRDYAIKLFSNGTPVIIKEGEDRYIVNKPEIFEQYKRAGKQVKMIGDCPPSTGSVEKVGFWE